MSNEGVDCSSAVDTAIRQQNWDILHWFNSKKYTWTNSNAQIAANTSNLDIVKFLQSNGCTFPENICSSIDSFEMLKWAVESGFKLSMSNVLYAIYSGDLDTVKWLRANNAPWGKSIDLYLGRSGNLELVQWVLANGLDDRNLCMNAVIHGHLHILEWALDNGYYLDETEALERAATKLETLKWFYNRGHIIGANIYDIAARNGCVEVVEWLLSVGVKGRSQLRFDVNNIKYVLEKGLYDGCPCNYVFTKGDMELTKYLLSCCPHCPHILAENEHWEMVKWLRIESCPWRPNVQEIMMTFGDYEKVRAAAWRLESFKKDNNPNVYSWYCCPEWEIVAEIAVKKGQLALLKFLKSTWCPMLESTCEIAAQKGYLDILKWAMENGFSWKKKQKGYHTEVIEALDKISCPWEIGSFQKMWKWAKKNGCRWDGNPTGYQEDILEWAKQKGYITDIEEIEDELDSESSDEDFSGTDPEAELNILWSDDEDDFNMRDDSEEACYYSE